jgi:hypothetical protein
MDYAVNTAEGNEKLSYSNLFLSVDVTEGQSDHLQALLRHRYLNYLQMSYSLQMTVAGFMTVFHSYSLPKSSP